VSVLPQTKEISYGLSPRCCSVLFRRRRVASCRPRLLRTTSGSRKFVAVTSGVAKPHPCQRKDEGLRATKRRVLPLSPANQLRIHEALSDELGGPLWQESERSRQSRRRCEALLVMAAAATHLGLIAPTAPSIPELKHAARKATVWRVSEFNLRSPSKRRNIKPPVDGCRSVTSGLRHQSGSDNVKASGWCLSRRASNTSQGTSRQRFMPRRMTRAHSSADISEVSTSMS
jgi:hypothetical protein